jgi:purine-binding chemotaxis protein CheW
MSEETTTTHQLVVFSLGEEEYALPIEAVHEIIRYTEPRSVASSVGWIRGVISLRGKIIPVYDLQEVLTIDPGQLEPVPSADGESIESIAKIDDRLIVLLNAAGLFGDAADVTALA